MLLGGEVGASGLPGDLGSAHGLDGSHAGEGPEVGVRDPVVGGLDGVKEGAGVLEAGVGAVGGLMSAMAPKQELGLDAHLVVGRGSGGMIECSACRSRHEWKMRAV